ncbi:RNA polymerase sigma factor [Bacillus phage PPIsBest]|uniref:RNA polymerase sigma factor n=3 Tax=Wphvirus TaxID=1922327 RepID=A0A222Z4G0_9CAUD|nr:RNA polymerase sigma factor [Bacillus phage SageFayge]AMW63146.1 sigma factor [Bacillus phage SageFayge]ASR78475.1 RNA polymerase sigma factor [Bacillus phage PPIsBest]ULF49432.1 RNA polymerase sigma factor [Bacillus phage MrBubbles]
MLQFVGHYDNITLSVTEGELQMIKHRELILRAQDGNEEAMEVLLTKYSGLMWSLINSHKINQNSHDDAYQELSQCFFKVVHAFDVERGFELGTYMTASMKGVLKNFMRNTKGFKIPVRLEPIVLKLRKMEISNRTNLELMVELDCSLEELQEAMSWLSAFKSISMDEEVNTGKSNNVADAKLGDIISSGEMAIDDRVALRDLIDRLPSKEKYIISKLYFDNEQQIDIAKEMRVTKNTIKNIELDALRNLRRMVGGDKARPSNRGTKPQVGDKKLCIELLRARSGGHKEISRLTGVPVGTISTWAKKVREGKM